MEKQNEMPRWMERYFGIGISLLGFVLIALSAYIKSDTATYVGLILTVFGLPILKTFKLISIKSDSL
jgi:hypothetical protein